MKGRLNLIRSLVLAEQLATSTSVSRLAGGVRSGWNVIFKRDKMKQSQRVKPAHQSAPTSGKWVSVHSKNMPLDDPLPGGSNSSRTGGRQAVDAVWLADKYAPRILDVEQAIEWHKELAAPDMLNMMDSSMMHARLLLDTTTKKKAKFMDNVKGSITYPHFFKDGYLKEVVAVCKSEEEIAACLEAGALLAGYTDILKKFEKGDINDQSYEYLVCTPETFADVMLLKKKISKDKLPSLKTNTVTENIAQLVRELHNAKDYQSNKVRDELAILKCKIGPLNFSNEQLVDNLGALVTKVITHKKHSPESFIIGCELYAAPSKERFKVNLSRFFPSSTHKENQSADREDSADAVGDETQEKQGQNQ